MNTRKNIRRRKGVLNVLSTPLRPCSNGKKMTGYFRDGFCTTGATDTGTHTVCAVMTREFLDYTYKQGNDLITPRPPFFSGLVPGDQWCLCAHRWYDAYRANKAPPVVLESTNKATLSIVPLKILKERKN